MDAPIINAETQAKNFTNEGGANGTTMLLKNVMGLWMLQSCRRSWAGGGHDNTYAGLMEAAGQAPAFQHLLDPDDPRFLNPPDMPAAIAEYCHDTEQPAPSEPGVIARAILESLALKYRRVIQDLEQITHRSITTIRIIGGGSKNRLLNQFTADATGKQVIAGPAEATALGNIAVQLAATGRGARLKVAREIIGRSFPVEVFEPRQSHAWASY